MKALEKESAQTQVDARKKLYSSAISNGGRLKDKEYIKIILNEIFNIADQSKLFVDQRFAVQGLMQLHIFYDNKELIKETGLRLNRIQLKLNPKRAADYDDEKDDPASEGLRPTTATISKPIPPKIKGKIVTIDEIEDPIDFEADDISISSTSSSVKRKVSEKVVPVEIPLKSKKKRKSLIIETSSQTEPEFDNGPLQLSHMSADESSQQDYFAPLQPIAIV